MEGEGTKKGEINKMEGGEKWNKEVKKYGRSIASGGYNVQEGNGRRQE